MVLFSAVSFPQIFATWDIRVGNCLGVPGLASAECSVCWDVVGSQLFIACESLATGESWICAGYLVMIG